MENNINNFDDLFRDASAKYAEAPPPHVWEALEKRLDHNKKRRVFPLRWFWYFSIVSFLTLLGASLAWNTTYKTGNTDVVYANPSINTNSANEVNTSVTSVAAMPKTKTHHINEDKKEIVEEQASKQNHHNQNKSTRAHKRDQIEKDTKTKIAATPTTDENGMNATAGNNGQAVGTSVYSYNDFEDEQARSSGNPAPGEITQGALATNNSSDFVARKTRKHNLVAVEMVPEEHAEKQQISQALETERNTESFEEKTTVETVATSELKKDEEIPKTVAVLKRKNKRSNELAHAENTKSSVLTNRSPANIKQNNTHNEPVLSSKATISKTGNKKYAASITLNKPSITNISGYQKEANKVATSGASESNKGHLVKEQKRIAKLNVTQPKNKPQSPNSSKILAQSNLPEIRIDEKASATGEKIENIASSGVANRKTEIKKDHKEDSYKKSGETTAQKQNINVKSKSGFAKQQATITKASTDTKSTTKANSNSPAIVDKAATTHSIQNKVAVTDKRKASVKKEAATKTNEESKNQPTAVSSKTDKKNKIQNTKAILPGAPVAAKKANGQPLVMKPNASLSKVILENEEPTDNDVTSGIIKEPVFTQITPSAQTIANVAEAKIAKDKLDTASKTDDVALKENAEKVDSATTEPDALRRLMFGIKGGYEGGFNRSTANKGIIAPYIQYNLSKKISIMLQPSLKASRLNKHAIGNTASFYDTKAGTGAYVFRDSSLVYLAFTGDSLWRRNYTYTESFDSIAKSYSVKGTYFEVELPFLMRYVITPKLSAYGGVNTVYSKFIRIHEDTYTAKGLTATGNPFTLAKIHDPAPVPTETGISYSGNPYAPGAAPLYTTQSGGSFRMGYMLGLSYEFKDRWMADILIQQTFIKPNIQAGYNVNSALSLPYLRFTIGYRLTK